MIRMLELECWQCQVPADRSDVVWSAVLRPRAASRGGPVLLFTCRHCGSVTLVERNAAGERLLSSPAVAGYRPPEADDAEIYAGIRWAEANREFRRTFQARTGPGPSGNPATPELGAGNPRPSKPGGPSARADPVSEKEPHDISDAVDLIDAYEILDLPLTAKVEEVRDRYRLLARKCHPDRVSDLDEDIRRLADRKFRRLKSARDLILRRTGPQGPSDTRS